MQHFTLCRLKTYKVQQIAQRGDPEVPLRSFALLLHLEAANWEHLNMLMLVMHRHRHFVLHMQMCISALRSRMSHALML